MTKKNSNFEVGVFIWPKVKHRSKYADLTQELLDVLPSLKKEQSVRKSYGSVKEAHAYANSRKVYFKNHKMQEKYAVGSSRQPEADGKFYVYIGRREGE